MRGWLAWIQANRSWSWQSSLRSVLIKGETAIWPRKADFLKLLLHFGLATRVGRGFIPRFDRVREFADSVEHAASPAEFAERYVAFSHWMLSSALRN